METPMEAIEDLWGLLGIAIIFLLLILAFFKKIRWRTFSISAVVYVVVLIAIGETVLAHPSMQTPEKRIFSIVASKSDKSDGDLMFDTDEKGNYVLKLKGTGDGQATVSTDEDKVIKTVDVHKGKISKVKIHMPAKEDEYDLTVTDNGNHSKKFTLNNESDANLALSCGDDPSADDSYQAALNSRKKHWNHSSDGNRIHVSAVCQDGHTTYVEVSNSDWHSLSKSDKSNFTDNWTNAIQNVYKMCKKNGQTSVQIVSSSDYSDVLATGSKSGSIKINN